MVDVFVDIAFWLTGGVTLMSTTWHIFFLMCSALVIWLPFWWFFFRRDERATRVFILCAFVFVVWTALIAAVEIEQYKRTSECIDTIGYTQTQMNGRINLLIVECRYKDNINAEYGDWKARKVFVLRNYFLEQGLDSER